MSFTEENRTESSASQQQPETPVRSREAETGLAALPPTRRIASMDQLRGYTIAGMIFVNYLGSYEVMPWMVKHHKEGMSYADTIAPLFMFIVGMGFRLSMKRRIAAIGPARAYWGAFVRYLGLTLLGMVFYGFGDWPQLFKGFQPGQLWEWLTQINHTGWWDALVDIGLAGIVSLPFINQSVRVRAIAAISCLVVYQAIFSLTGYGAWEMANSLNGGPLGPVSYAFVLLMGTIAYDILETRNTVTITVISLELALALCAAGLLLRFEWPGVKGYWPFSQYYMTAPYPVYSTGLAFLAFLGFHILCDVFKLRIPTFTILGENPLVIYLIQAIIQDSGDSFFRHDMTARQGIAVFVVGYLLCYGIARKLHNDRIIIKL